MDGKRISQLTPDTSPSTDDYIVTVDGATTQNKRVELGSLPVSNPTRGYVDNRTPIYGLGFPNGVVIATPGRIYIDENITNGASSWIKKSGTGNTGWQVLEGDTGWRDITSLVNTSYFTATPAFNNYINVRIKDGKVHIVGRLVPHTDVGVPERQILASFSSLDTAYRSALPDQMFVLAVDTSDLNTPPVKLIRGYMNSGGQFGTLYWLAGRSYSFSVSYDNTGAWPVALPGTAI